MVLLRAQFAGLAAAPPVGALPADWANRLRADQAAPANRGAWLPAGWSYFDDATRQIVDVTRDFDARSPAVVTFSGTLPPGQWLLCAVVLAQVKDDGVAVGDKLHGCSGDGAACRRPVASSRADVKRLAFTNWPRIDGPRVHHSCRPRGDARLIVEDENESAPEDTAASLLHGARRRSTDVTLPAGVWRASWVIQDSAGRVVATHPGYTVAAPANIANGSFIQVGRSPRPPAGGGAARTLWSRASIAASAIVPNPPVVGARWASSRRSARKGARIPSSKVPKNEAEMADPIANNIGDPGQPFNSADGQHPQDIWIAAYRGTIDDGHFFFLGRGIMEATETLARPSFGAPATPKAREYKGWVRTLDAGADRCQLEDLTLAGTNSLLLNATDGVPSNPYFTNEPGLPSPQPRKNFVQAHAGSRIWTGDGTTAGCTAISRTIRGPSSTPPGVARRGDR